MEPKGQRPRFNALHVVEAELDHLDWATRQPALHVFDAHYWRRRVEAIQTGYELTQKQSARIDQILRRLNAPEE